MVRNMMRKTLVALVAIMFISTNVTFVLGLETHIDQNIKTSELTNNF